MKKTIKTTLIIILLVTLISGGVVEAASTETYHEYAMNLYSIGLFKGTDIGFELDRVPTRLEGAVMFVRLLGGEQEAFNENYSHPFNDVPDWGDPYIGYLYHHELTNGISSDEFGSYLGLKAIEYVTFGLRALGFSDKGSASDFTWDLSVFYAEDNNILTEDLFSELTLMEFSRGHVAWVSYELLLANPKDSTDNLIDVLVADGSISENSAGSVFSEYENDSRVVSSVGETWAKVVSDNGSPTDEFTSRYGFVWHIFGMNYDNYIQVGEQNGIVKAVLSASLGYGYEKGITIGMTKSDIIAAYGDTELTQIRKILPDGSSAINYMLNNTEKSTYITDGGDYITYYYDLSDNSIVAFLVIDKETEEATHNNYISSGSVMELALEEQVYHITNAVRVQKGVDILAVNIAAAEIAEGHSVNMVINNFFSHTDPEGRGPGDRASERGIPYWYLAENLAYGYRNPLDMVNGWLNSQTGHREALLGDYKYLGIGVSLKDGEVMYCTQEFWR